MARNLKQVYNDDPITTLGNDDLVYAVKPPYNLTSDAGIKYSDLAIQIGANFPLKNGTGATGTWGINISGNAATATLASTVTTNANLSGVVTSVGNVTSIPNSSITSAMLAVPYLPLSGGTVSGTITADSLISGTLALPTSNASSSVYVTDGSGNSSVANTLPTGLTIPGYALTSSLSSYFLKTGGTITGTTAIDVNAPNANAGLELYNTATTGTTSNAIFSLITRQAGGGDPTIIWSLTGSPAVSYYMGIDNTDDTLKIGLDSTVGTSTALSIQNSTGAVSLGVPLGVSSGGSGANISPTNGSVVYTNSSNMALTGIGLAGQIFQSSGGGSPVWSSAAYPATATVAGRIIRADGTNWTATTATFADTYASGTVLMANTANAVVGSTTLPSGLSATNLSLTTPTLGAATATSITFSPTTGGIVGTTTNDSAGTGKVGEYLSTTVLMGSAVSATNNSAVNVATLSLTAGDWDVSGNVCTAPAASTITTGAMGWISTTSAAIPTYPNSGALARIQGFTTSAAGETFLTMGTRRLSLSGTTTVYLTAYMTFSASTLSVYGFIGARRAR